jgi:hypothetical protein
MPSRFYPISRNEIDEFLTSLGFRPLPLKGVVELVYAKIVRVGDHRLSLRVYTAVDPGGESREKGKDAIRVQLLAKVQIGNSEEIVPVGRTQKCLRVVSWRQNLGKAIQGHDDPYNFRLCPACGNPMVLRENRETGEGFWGCTLFRITGCKGRRQDVAWPDHQTTPTVMVR